MKYFIPNIQATMESEMMWFVIGLVAGIILMAMVDFVIDRSKK